MFILESERLRAEIAEPGENPNTGFRFGRAAFIADITLDGERHFGANEPKNLIHPSSGGRGLCCEYTADLSGEAAVGEYFPKLGVGLIRKEEEEPYCFHKRYRDVREYPVSIEKGRDWARFVTEPVSCMGYAVREERKISVSGNRLTMEVILENTGEKPILTGEYCHNFLSIDGMAITPDYHLDLPGLPELGVRDIPNLYPSPCNFHADGDGIEILRSETAVSLAEIPLCGLDSKKQPFSWRLSHKGAKAAVSVEEYLVPSKITLWETDHIFSAEMEHTISLAPGENKSWKRVYTFENLA